MKHSFGLKAVNAACRYSKTNDCELLVWAGRKKGSLLGSLRRIGQLMVGWI